MNFETWKLEQLELGNLIISICKRYKGDLVGKWKRKYSSKLSNSKTLNREFTLTFEEYLYKCFEAGLICPTQIGQKRLDYQLGRYKDQGGYTIDNCRFITQLENMKELSKYTNLSEISIKVNNKKLENGTHNFLNIKPWNNHNATINSLEVWSKANECYNWWIENNNGYKILMREFNFKSSVSCNTLIKKFKSGWIPSKDPDWFYWSKINKL